MDIGKGMERDEVGYRMMDRPATGASKYGVKGKKKEKASRAKYGVKYETDIHQDMKSTIERMAHMYRVIYVQK